MEKDTQIWFRIDTATRRRLERLAAQQQRTLSNMVRVLLNEALERSYPTPPAPQQQEAKSA